MCTKKHLVVAIAPDPRHNGCVRVQIDDEVLSLPIECIIDLSLAAGRSIDVETKELVVFEARCEQAKRLALRLLAGRSYTEAELTARLQKADYADCADRVLPWLKRLGYIDDRRFAERWVEHRAARKGLGPRRLRHELAQRGVSRDIISEAVDLPRSEVEKAARELARKRRRRYENLPAVKAYARLYSFLERRGFPADIIHRVLREEDDNAQA